MKDWITYLLPISATLVSVLVSLYSSFKYFKKNNTKKEELKKYLVTSAAFKELQKSLVDSEQLNEEEVLKDFEKINNIIKKLFDEVTHSNCRTTIKVISYDNTVPVVISLVSQNVSKRSKQAIFMNKTKLFDDTSLSILFSKPFDYFLNNDLSKVYGNIHFPATIEKDDYKIYYSTLVVPIIRAEKINSEKCVIYGFLSIDSDKKNVFNKDLHISLAKTFGNSLMPFIETWTNRITESKGLSLKNQILSET
nr:hypothetical protein [uncultured Sediminibacterium sp.]